MKNVKFEKVVTNNYKGWFDYVCGNVIIRKTHDTNIFTGKEMREQVWNIFVDGQNVDFALTLKEAKEIAKNYIK